MPEELVENLLPPLNTRREYFDYLDRWTVGIVDELRAHMTTRALVKAFLLETSRRNGSRDVIATFRSMYQEINRVDDTLYRIRWNGETSDWALIEVEDERYPVLYTALKTDIANRRVDQLVNSSSLLDKAWFAAPMFQRLWKLVLDAYPSYRFSKIVFEHESIYEAFLDDISVGPDSEEEQDDVGDEEDVIIPERRRARMQITERIGKLAKALQKMRPEYEPLESIVSMRIPAPRRGGHDVYFDGRFTNRSDSITSLRQTVEVVAKIYRYSTEMAEDASWPQTVDAATTLKPISLGMPLLIKFSQELDMTTFERWIAALRRKNNRFRLWGNPIDRGPGKVHIYAVDNHLWQTVDLEITRDHLYALLPSGTCGNTIHRLIANIQQFIDPKLETYIGDKKYEDFIDQAPVDRTSGDSPHA
jgi:hypothetical protein